MTAPSTPQIPDELRPYLDTIADRLLGVGPPQGKSDPASAHDKGTSSPLSAVPSTLEWVSGDVLVGNLLIEEYVFCCIFNCPSVRLRLLESPFVFSVLAFNDNGLLLVPSHRRIESVSRDDTL